MAADLRQMVRGLSPQALDIFKRQIAALPEQERERTFSQLSGIPELSNITGTAPVYDEPSFWGKVGSAVTAPFRWIGENVTEPFGAAALAPFTPGIEESRQKQIIESLPWFQQQLAKAIPAYGRELAEYSAWEAPGINVPVLGRLDVKTAVETIPWLAVPMGAGVIAKGAGLAAKVAAPIARATATGAGFIEEVGGAGTRLVGTTVGKTAGEIAAKSVGAAAKGVGAVERAIAYPISKPLEILGRKLGGSLGDQIAQIHNLNQGATVNIKEGNLLGKRLYAVGNFPERSIEIKGSSLTGKQVSGFLKANEDLLAKPELSFGSWVDSQGNTVMDIVRTLPDRAEALKVGSELGEKAIFGLGGEGELDVASTLSRDTTKDILKASNVFNADEVISIAGKREIDNELKRRIKNLTETIVDYTAMATEQATEKQKLELVQRLIPYVHEHAQNLKTIAANPENKLAVESGKLSGVLDNIEKDLLSPDRRVANIAVDQLMQLVHRREATALPQIFGIPKKLAEDVGVGVREIPDILTAISEGKLSPKPFGYDTPPEVIQQWMANLGEGAPGLTWNGKSAIFRSPEGRPVGEVALTALPDGKIQVDRFVVDDKSLLKGKAIKSFLEASEQLPDLVPPPPSEMSKQAQAFWEKYQQKLGERDYARVKTSIPTDIKASTVPPNDRKICIW